MTNRDSKNGVNEVSELPLPSRTTVHDDPELPLPSRSETNRSRLNFPDGKDLDYPDFREPPPEDFMASGRRRLESHLTELPPARDGLPGLILFGIAGAVSSAAWNRPEWFAKLAPTRDLVFGQHEYWRLLTGILLHADVGHLLSNAPLLLIFGWFLRSYFGSPAFPIMAVILGIGAHAATLWQYAPQTQLVGASGLVYAMVAMWLGLYIRFSTNEKVLSRIFRAGGFTLALMLPTTFEARTSYLAHAIGFGLGLLGAIMYPRRYTHSG